MKRTQLYMDETTLRLLAGLSRHKGTTISELVRQAVQKIYGARAQGIDTTEALDAAFGIWAKRKDVGSGTAYVRRLRRGGRAKRFGLA